MLKANKLYVIGIGYRPLDQRARDILLGAEVILASSRLFDVFKRYNEFEAVKNRIKVIDKVPQTIEFIKEFLHTFRTPDRFVRGQAPDQFVRGQAAHVAPVVLLASGDPQFFGIGRRIIEEFGRDEVEILPDLSSIQIAFARINEPWDDAFFISLHGGPDIARRRKLPYEISDIPDLLERYNKIGILTDKENNPTNIAEILRARSAPDGSVRGQALHSALITVCERLGYPDEKVSQGSPEEIAGMSFNDPNVVIIKQESGIRSQESGVRFGLREDEIEHERGLITKDEVRAVTIHKLRLPRNGVFWDVGAGSGSVSLEVARLCSGLRVFAIEKDAARIETIRVNVQKYGLPQVRIIHGSASDVLGSLPAPDRVFIGGSGGHLGEIVRLIGQKMPSGIIVINAATLDTLNASLSALEHNGFSLDVSEISVSRSKDIAGKRQMNALNPVFIIRGEKG